MSSTGWGQILLFIFCIITFVTFTVNHENRENQSDVQKIPTGQVTFIAARGQTFCLQTPFVSLLILILTVQKFFILGQTLNTF